MILGSGPPHGPRSVPESQCAVPVSHQCPHKAWARFRSNHRRLIHAGVRGEGSGRACSDWRCSGATCSSSPETAPSSSLMGASHILVFIVSRQLLTLGASMRRWALVRCVRVIRRDGYRRSSSTRCVPLACNGRLGRRPSITSRARRTAAGSRHSSVATSSRPFAASGCASR